MTWLRMLGTRSAGLFRRSRGDAELDEELQFHLEMEEAENRRKGMSAGEARIAARRSFGNVTGARELHREGRGFAALETLAQDVRYGLRMMARNPDFTAVAVLTMALGIGINSAIFSVTDAVLLRPLPYPEPDRIVEIGFESGPNVGNFNARMFEYLRERGRSCDQLAAAMYNSGILVAGKHVEHVRTLEVTAEYFSALGVSPALGRDFSRQDENQGVPWSVVLSNDLWRNRFASDPSVIGTTVQLRGQLHTVIGVMPRTFWSYPPRDVWTPLRVNILSGGRNYRGLGR